jgi:hypothetical protein
VTRFIAARDRVHKAGLDAMRTRPSIVVAAGLLCASLQLSGEARALWAQQLDGCGLFATDNIWNTRVDTLPLAVDSATYVATIGAGTGVHPDFGSGDWPPGSGSPIGIPFDSVPPGQLPVPVTFVYADESDAGPYPIPPDASIEGGPASDGDRHVLVLERGSCTLYELYDAHPMDGGAWWGAGSGAVFPLDSYALRPAGWTSADAAGLPILPGLVRYEEVAAGRIEHALRFTAPETRRAYVWPARHFASSLTGAEYPPMGQRFRLRADFDVSGFSPPVQVILRALKEYGMMLADNGSAWFISGVPDERWDNEVLAELRTVEGSSFEAVDVSSLMVDPDSSLAVPPCAAADRLVVNDATITDRQVYRACDEIVFGPNVAVMGPYGEAVLSAGRRVVLIDDVALLPDGRLEIVTGHPLVPE